MAHHKSALKRIRTSAKANLRNRHYRSMMRTAIRKVREAPSADVRIESLRIAGAVLDRLATKGIIPQRTASRRKSRLAKLVASANLTADNG